MNPHRPRPLDLPAVVPLEPDADLSVLDEAKIIAAPDDPGDLPRWREQLARWWGEARERTAYDGYRYERGNASDRGNTDCFVVGLAWLWDELLYDHERGSSPSTRKWRRRPATSAGSTVWSFGSHAAHPWCGTSPERAHRRADAFLHTQGRQRVPQRGVRLVLRRRTEAGRGLGEASPGRCGDRPVPVDRFRCAVDLEAGPSGPLSASGHLVTDVLYEPLHW